MSLVAYGDSSSDSEVEEEGEPAADAPKSDVRKLLGLLPPPKGSKPSDKHPVRISLPTVKSGKDSDDEEEDVPQVKRVKIHGGGSRLTALLPEPKSQPKLLGAPRRGAAESMVPYTLSKRRQDSIKSEKLKAMRAKSRGKPTTSSGGGNAGSDSDEEPVSFFSHLEETAGRTDSGSGTVVAPLKVSGPALATPSANTSLIPTSSRSGSDPSQTTYNASSSATVSTYSEGSYLQSTPHGSQDQSEQQQTVSGYSWEQFTSPAPNPAPYTPQPYVPPQQYYNTSGPSNAPAVSPAGDVGEFGGPSEAGADEEGGASGEGGEGGEGGGGGGKVMEGTGPGVVIDKEALRRLAGGGHKRRGREEALNNVMDILGDEVMEDVRIYRRHYGEDPSITKLYKVDNSKLKTPTSNQKRKHQITWLAHEAKEKELELQKQWAVGSQTRKDSRSKYGF